MFCQREFAEHGLELVVAQANVGLSRRRGTVHGMHFQVPPVAETKLVRCTRGAALDVIVDLRPVSATDLEHVAVELTPESGRPLYSAKRFADGYQTPVDATETSYLLSEFHTPEAEGRPPRRSQARDLTAAPGRAGVRDHRRWLSLAEAEPEIRRRMTLALDPA